MVELTKTIVVAGRDKTKTGAFVAAMNRVQGQVTKEVQGLPFRIEPVSVSVKAAKEFVETEAFLFFFMKREIKQYALELEVTAKITLMDVESIPFTKEYKKQIWRKK